ncbi:MAG: hypothetical protein KDA42_09900 [Planctomycetales bacterium]|nr:hypothetical protein [Planctomycetales bacterium]
MTDALKIVGLGEALFDVFDDREVLGGAPLNVAVQAHALLQAARQGEGIVVSRIGADARGARLRDDVAARGMAIDWLQVDSQRPTGTVLVTLQQGEPHYEIVADVAWDFLQATDELHRLAETCSAVCFGTLAQRSDAARSSIHFFLERAATAIRLFDVNLRQEYFDADILAASCQLATIVKLNEAELPQVVAILATAGKLPASSTAYASLDDQAAALREAFALRALVLTRGKLGTTLYESAGKATGEPVSYPRDANADSVGAGDACSAGILFGLLHDWPSERTVQLANHLGAFVASQPGATPTLPAEIMALVR